MPTSVLPSASSVEHSIECSIECLIEGPSECPPERSIECSRCTLGAADGYLHPSASASQLIWVRHAWHRRAVHSSARACSTDVRACVQSLAGGCSRASASACCTSSSRATILSNVSGHADGERRGARSSGRAASARSRRDLSDAALLFDLAPGVRRRHAPQKSRCRSRRASASACCTSSSRLSSQRSRRARATCSRSAGPELFFFSRRSAADPSSASYRRAL